MTEAAKEQEKAVVHVCIICEEGFVCEQKFKTGDAWNYYTELYGKRACNCHADCFLLPRAAAVGFFCERCQHRCENPISWCGDLLEHILTLTKRDDMRVKEKEKDKTE